MADLTFITIKPPLKAVDNQDGTFSVSILDVNSAEILTALEDILDNSPIDPITAAREIVEHPHHEIHAGSAFSIHIDEADFDKSSEIGILFTTPNTAEWCHLVPIIDCGTIARFQILRGPTLDTENYPTTFYVPRNRNENSEHPSAVLDVRAVPVVNSASLKLKADTTPISADGFVVHTEIVGTGKKGGGVGSRQTDEYVLKQNTTYYFRLLGLGTGSDNSVASMEITWYEHTNVV